MLSWPAAARYFPSLLNSMAQTAGFLRGEEEEAEVPEGAALSGREWLDESGSAEEADSKPGLR